MTTNTTKCITNSKVLDLIQTAMLIAMVFVATLLINIRLPISPNGRLVHLGTDMLFIISILFGPKKGALVGAVGIGLFDLISGWTLQAPFTIVAREAILSVKLRSRKSMKEPALCLIYY